MDLIGGKAPTALQRADLAAKGLSMGDYATYVSQKKSGGDGTTAGSVFN